jgi:hypothetical protein
VSNLFERGIRIVDSPFIVAILVFLSIYFVFFLIRLFADFIIVGIALFCTIFTYYFLYDPVFYSTILENLVYFSKEVPMLSMLFQKLGLPEQLEQLDKKDIIVIASMITALAVLISIPFLPFSATYRFLLGVENPVFQRKEAKVRGWIVEEIENHHRQDEAQQAQLRSD